MQSLSPYVPVQLAIVLSDKSNKSVSVQEANVTVPVNSMQRHLELPIREEENNPAPIKGKNQLTIMRFAVATPQCSQVPRVRSPM